MDFKLFSIFLFNLAVCFVLVLSQEDDDPFTVELESFEISKEYDTKFVDWNSLRMTKKARNLFVISGIFKANMNLANQQKVHLQVFRYDGQLKRRGPLVFSVEKEVCKFMAEDEDIYPGLVEVSNLPEPGTCPLEKGDYNIQDYMVQANFLPDDTPTGDYVIVSTLKDDTTPVAAMEIYINISKS